VKPHVRSCTHEIPEYKNLHTHTYICSSSYCLSFLNIPVYPDNHHFGGMKWDKVFIDLALVFGLRTFPTIQMVNAAQRRLI